MALRMSPAGLVGHHPASGENETITRKVGVAHGRKAELPAHVFVLAEPVGVVERQGSRGRSRREDQKEGRDGKCWHALGRSMPRGSRTSHYLDMIYRTSLNQVTVDRLKFNLVDRLKCDGT